MPAAARRAKASRGLMAKSTAGTVTTKPGANTLSLYNASHITHKRAGKPRFPALSIATISIATIFVFLWKHHRFPMAMLNTRSPSFFAYLTVLYVPP